MKFIYILDIERVGRVIPVSRILEVAPDRTAAGRTMIVLDGGHYKASTEIIYTRESVPALGLRINLIAGGMSGADWWRTIEAINNDHGAA